MCIGILCLIPHNTVGVCVYVMVCVYVWHLNYEGTHTAMHGAALATVCVVSGSS